MNDAPQAPARRADSAEAGPLGLVVKRCISLNLIRALARPPWCRVNRERGIGEFHRRDHRARPVTVTMGARSMAFRRRACPTRPKDLAFVRSTRWAGAYGVRFLAHRRAAGFANHFGIVVQRAYGDVEIGRDYPGLVIFFKHANVYTCPLASLQ